MPLSRTQRIIRVSHLTTDLAMQSLETQIALLPVVVEIVSLTQGSAKVSRSDYMPGATGLMDGVSVVAVVREVG